VQSFAADGEREAKAAKGSDTGDVNDVHPVSPIRAQHSQNTASFHTGQTHAAKLGDAK
jgi:hypothetical protein